MKDLREIAQECKEELMQNVKKQLENFKADKQKEVFADFDKMVAHLARTHALYQDEIARLLAAWFNAQPGCLSIYITSPESVNHETVADSLPADVDSINVREKATLPADTFKEFYTKKFL